MKKLTALVMVFAIALVAAGCAKKTASEQLQDDMKKASDQMKKDLGKL